MEATILSLTEVLQPAAVGPYARRPHVERLPGMEILQKESTDVDKNQEQETLRSSQKGTFLELEQVCIREKGLQTNWSVLLVIGAMLQGCVCGLFCCLRLSHLQK